MALIRYFTQQPGTSETPARFPDPFDNNPHPLALDACDELQQYLLQETALMNQLMVENSGKMFGVLVIQDKQGQLGYLSAFSGKLNKQWLVNGFVPPVFDTTRQQSFLDDGEKCLEELTERLQRLLNCPQRKISIKALEKMGFDHEEKIKSLKRRHSEKKLKRKQSRQTLQDDKGKQEKLTSLSFQSQRDKKEFKRFKLELNDKIQSAQEVHDLNYEREIYVVQKKRKQLSQKLHQQVFEGYQLINANGDTTPLMTFFKEKKPPGGAGDCAAPKLIQYAHINNLEPIALAEFWWGASPVKEVRHHGFFYPPCRGKCQPILPYMLNGCVPEVISENEFDRLLTPEVMYEDDVMIVINKPAGLLSIPGKKVKYSVESWLKQHYPNYPEILLLHRLDMGTSGLMLAAKNLKIHKILQRQFMQRKVKKRYVAILSKAINEKKKTIDLPLRVDIDDRPRQLVCFEFGKQALTYVEKVCTDKAGCRVHFYPVTGRTHQLRVHAAHEKGLNSPIVGDGLYGKAADRLYLHADMLTFEHPTSGELFEIKSTCPF